ncbi:alpha-hydroxy-acid oxidizing protein [Paracoccus sp. Z118]|uniref:alpha-hydroxy acid oxidase n=1 Tax=Paracoccus sp. Z118 TaxID=2851017 RepID=UPI001C2C08CA|nr:alpha-hydroxy acid oxidase [Paracoccus sp. Z118]MBV0893298.1 alpha-hydroxy-acid oxidizing protein [Paracoccus sp. Z118]
MLRDRFLNLNDFEVAARRRLPKSVYSYIASAVEDGRSLKMNREAFDRYALLTRVMVNVSQVSTEVELFGQRFAAPIGVAPMGLAALSSYRGDLVLARAASACNVPVVMSGSSLIPLEEVMEAVPGTWFQAYLPGDQAQIDALMSRVRSAGTKTLVITVDTPAVGNREADRRAGFSAPLRPGPRLAWQGGTRPRWLTEVLLRTLLRHGMPHFENNYAQRGAPILSRNVLRDFSDRRHLNWDHLRTIRRQWRGALIVKGILHPLDARTAREIGVDGIVISNHGGRQLDGAVPPLRMLPRVMEEAGELPVLVDSGIRRGTDVVKLLSLGARAVLIGRPFGFAAAMAGQPGVEHAIRLIWSELSRNMQMMGVTRLADLGPEFLVDMDR